MLEYLLCAFQWLAVIEATLFVLFFVTFLAFAALSGAGEGSEEDES